MTTYIALLRGINVGGHNKIPMKELKQLLADAGFADVRTYIQSGNILISVHTTDHEQNRRAREIFERAGAEDIASADEARVSSSADQLKNEGEAKAK